MANPNNYDYNYPFSPTTPQNFDDVFNLPNENTSELNDIAITPTDFNQSNNSNLSFSAQLIPNNDHVSMPQYSNNNDFELFAPNTNPLTIELDASSIESLFNEDQNEKLQILVQPKESYRGRYTKEVNRFLRGEGNRGYPTIKIPSWCRLDQQVYIRVTLVTVPNARAPYHCIHPYGIDTPDPNVIRDQSNSSSLFFRINEQEFVKREKKFLIRLLKKKEDELKSHETFRLFDSNQPDCQRVQNLQDAKEIKTVYELSKSKLVFTIAQLQNDKWLNMPHTSVESRIMIDNLVVTPTSSTGQPNGTSINGVKCIPQQGNWVGGDEIVIIMPNPIKRKVYTIYIDFGEYGGQQPINEIIHIDTKSLLFRTPRCPILEGDHNLKVSIIIQDNKSFIHPIDFSYLTSIKSTINLCSHCQENSMNNKRRWKYDNGESLVSQMDQLSIKQKTNKSRCHPSSLIAINEKLIEFDKYIHQLKDALAIFVRTNNPSQLFRRTGILLSTYDGKSSPLHDAIQHGHIELALALIDIPLSKRLLENENENGETPLLIAVKLNQWKLIESILKNRSDFAKQEDKNGNNLFHLLANLNEDKGVDTIENISKILPDALKINLLKQKNKTNQKPMDIAQSHNNTSSLELLIDIENNS